MVNEKVKRQLIEFNPLWKGAAPSGYKERRIYRRLKPLLKEPQIIALCGLRRVGKTMLLRKMMEDLLREHPADALLYFSFDDFPSAELLDVIEGFREIHGKEPRFLFFDEVQKVPNWAGQVKVLYDTGKFKIVVSGSESLFLRKSSRESLAGRMYEFEVRGLAFPEYLAFAGKAALAEKPQLHGTELQRELVRHLLTGGFPELIGKDSALVRQYIRTAVIEKIVFLDMARLYPIDEPAVLLSVLEMLIERPGMLVDFASLSRDLGISRQTLSKYFDYLQQARLVVKLSNFSKNRSTSEKRLKRFYPAFLSPALLAEADAAHMGMVVENACVLASGAEHFWRDRAKDEVDIVLRTPGALLPVEVKYRNDQERNRGLEKFCKKYACAEAVVVTKDVRRVAGKGPRIRRVPAREFLIEFPE